MKKWLVALSACAAFAAHADDEKRDGFWYGDFGVGISATGGNTDASSVNIALEALRLTDVDKWQLYLKSLYASKKENGRREKTASQTLFGAKYDHDINTNWYGFVSTDFERDSIKDLSLRSVLGLGLGYHVVRTDDVTVDVFSGVAYNREKYKDLTRSATEIILGEEGSYRLSESSELKQKILLYPSLTRSGDYRAIADIGVATALTDRLNLNVGVGYRYQNKPAPGIKKYDTLFLTTISAKFGPK